MKICKDCFSDEQLREVFVVESNSTEIGICEVTEKSAQALLDVSFFNDFFSELLSQFEVSNDGKSISEIIQRDWNLFASLDYANVILKEILSYEIAGFRFGDKVDYSEVIKDRVGSWSRLKNDVRSSRRFFTSYEEFSQYAYIVPESVLKKGDRLYRARILPHNIKKLRMKEMEAPPAYLATAGRANPAGIPYLYLCSNEQTTYYEVRAAYLDKLAVGVFRAAKDLKIVDFDTRVSLYYAYSDSGSITDVIVNKLILDQISQDMSKPMRRYDSELEYIPTQMICEYCKCIVGADGVSFKSSVHKEGRNYVLFNNGDAKCTKIFYRIITKVEIGT